MRIYAVADIHGKPRRIERIRQNIGVLRPHLLVAAGDVSGRLAPRDALHRLDALPVPVLAIGGNSDPAGIHDLFSRFPNITSLHAVRLVLSSQPLVGIGGAVALPLRSKIRFRETPLLEQIEPLVDCRTILVAHPPPAGVLDTVMGRFHVGSVNLRRFVDRLQPRLLICGHVHESAGVSTIGKTVVVNCAVGRRREGALVDCTPGKQVEIKMI